MNEIHTVRAKLFAASMVTLSFFAADATAEAPPFIWSSAYADANQSWSPATMVAHTNGDIYVVGEFVGTADFGGGQTLQCPLGVSHMFLAKYNAAHQIQWSRSVCSTSQTYPGDLAIRTDGSVVITGVFGNTATFGSTSADVTITGSNPSALTSFVAIYDATGEVSTPFTQNATSGYGAIPTDIGVDVVGNIYVKGSYHGTVNFGTSQQTSPAAGTEIDIYLAKYNASGAEQWVRTAGNTGNTNYYYYGDLQVDQQGEVYVSGPYYQAIDWDGDGTSEPATHERDGYIAKFDAAGNVKWVNYIHGQWADHPHKMALDAQGNLYVGGNYHGDATFTAASGTGIAAAPHNGLGHADGFIARYTPNGAIAWFQHLGGARSDVVTGLDVTEDGVYAGGYYRDQTNFFSGFTTLTNPATDSNPNVWLAKLDLSGNPQWVKDVATPGFQELSDLLVAANGELIIQSSYQGDAPLLDGLPVMGASVEGKSRHFIAALGVSFVVSPTSGLVTTEDGGIASFDVKLASQPSYDVTLNLHSSDVAEGTVFPAQLTFTSANWNTIQSVTVVGVDDALAVAETQYFIHFDPAQSLDPNFAGKIPDSVSVTNLDNDNPLIEVSSVTVNEAAGTISIEITRSQNFDPITVTCTAVGGSATEGLDFNATPTDLVFNGNPQQPTKTCDITILDDVLVEGTETVLIQLSNSTVPDATLVDGVVSIIDDEGAPQISVDDVTMAEGSAMLFTVSLSHTSTTDTIVTYVTVGNGSATPNVDFLVVSDQVTIPANSLSATIAITATADMVCETEETFALVLTGSDNGTIISDTTGIGTIDDSANRPVVAITGATQLDEGETITLTVSRTGTCNGQDTTVQFATQQVQASPSTTPATINEDFVGVSQTLTWIGNDETAKTIEVSALCDQVTDRNEKFKALLFNPTLATIDDRDNELVLTIKDKNNCTP